jgi:hypothetical protein
MRISIPVPGVMILIQVPVTHRSENVTIFFNDNQTVMISQYRYRMVSGTGRVAVPVIFKFKVVDYFEIFG